MLVAQDIALPCGLHFRNRIAKAALAENLAPNHTPEEAFPIAYSNWADGGWGMVLTGNVQVSDHFLGGPKDVEIPSKEVASTQKAWKEWAATCQRSGTPTLVQLNHPGRQSPYGAGKRGFFAKNLAPSPIPMDFGSGILAKTISVLLFGTPKEMTVQDIQEVIEQFVRGAKQSVEAGFAGIELHGAHGYLLAQFLSPLTNHRTDDYGGSAAKRARIVLEIIKRTRAATSPTFCIGIKFNSVDVASADMLADTIEQIGLIADAGIDFLEISGGSYENPVMAAEALPAAGTEVKKSSTVKREAFFLEFAQSVRASYPKLVLMVTGGFRTRVGMEAALKSGACDIIGIGRPSTVMPHLPKDIILNEEIKDEEASVKLKRVEAPWWMKYVPVKAIGAGMQSVYYGSQIGRLAKGLRPIDTRA